MSLLLRTLLLCAALLLSHAAPSHHEHIAKENKLHADAPGKHDHDHDHHKDHGHGDHGGAIDKRCEGIEFDAITVNENGILYFFKDDQLWKGFGEASTPFNATFHELDDHHLGHIDAAFRVHHHDDKWNHYHIYFLLDDKVFSYVNNTLETGFPKNIKDVFPGVPDHIDAAVECPKGECDSESYIFFKGDDVYHFDAKTNKTAHTEWAHLPNCTAAFRWMDHYYCFHGHQFTRFHPVTGVVSGKYPKDAQKYFTKCPKFAHGSDHTAREICSQVPLDALTSDNAGNQYAFRGHYYLSKAAGSPTWKAQPIEAAFKEVHDNVDTAFTYQDHIYLTKDDKIYAYKTGDKHVLEEGYPKKVKDFLGIKGHLEATFLCGDQKIVHVIQDTADHKGEKMIDVDLSTTPHTLVKELPVPFHHIDTATCDSEGVKIVVGPFYYVYKSAEIMALSKIKPPPHKVSVEMFGCEH